MTFRPDLASIFPLSTKEGAYVAPEKQIIAVIAYLQKLGTFEELDEAGRPVPLPEMRPGVPDAHRATPASLAP